MPLGFTPMDKTIGTGLRAGELLLIGGAQGTGKTTMALQMARNIASGGQANVLYICFEHDEPYLLSRLIAMESALAHLPHKTGAIKIQDVRKEILGTWMAEGTTAPQLANNPRLRPSLDRIARYGQNLFLLRGSQTARARSTTSGELVQQHRNAVRRSPARRVRRLHAEGAPGPGARERGGEGHLHRQRPQGHRAVRGGADGQHRGRGQGWPQGALACATSTCAVRRRSTTRRTSSSSSTRSTTSWPRSTSSSTRTRPSDSVTG
ncbi:MAG: DnaB-like helicase C-terminal domain-containing protein [Candidatus Limnocylindrales bacterium]